MKHPIVYLKFLDHVSSPANEASLVECEVIGVLYKEDTKAYYVASWICENDFKSHDTETFIILKSAVLKKRKLK